MNTVARLLITVLAFTLSLTACGGGGQGDTPAPADTSNPDGGSAYKNKVYLDQATLQQLAQFTFTCQGHKICVEICHRPPGNPQNAHIKHLPLQATSAHLHHGGNQHAEKDYLGSCELNPGQAGDSPVTTGPSTDPNDPGNGGDPADTPTGEIPAWCTPYVQLDANCDGIVDTTGDRLL